MTRRILPVLTILLFLTLAFAVASEAVRQQPSPVPTPMVSAQHQIDPKPAFTAKHQSAPLQVQGVQPVQPVMPTLTGSIPPTAQGVPATVKSLDQLLDDLEKLRAKKAELEKMEQQLIKAIQEKSQKQAERMKQLGVAPQAAPGTTHRVGRIIIEGNCVTPDEKFLELLKLSPGSVLENDVLEKARERFKKAGFQTATVELIPNEWDSVYQDIRVKVIEKE